MSLKEFCVKVPLSRDIRIMLVGNVIFEGRNLNDRFIAVTPYELRNKVTNMNGHDYTILEVAIENNMLTLELV